MHPTRIAQLFSGALMGARAAAVFFFFCCAGSDVHAQESQGPEEVRRRAAEAYDLGNLREALADYERLVSLYPEEACLHGRLAGCALTEPGRLALVRRHLRIALRKGCSDQDLSFHQARLAHLEYDFERAGDLYAAYLASAGKKARFKSEAETAVAMCRAVEWDPSEAVALEVFERIPADPEASFRYYEPEVDGLRLVATPRPLRSKADLKAPAGRMALHDGDTVLVFSSLGKKGSFGRDLFRVSIRMGEYTEPIRLEGGVNSSFDEQDAYLSKDGLLYFASNRPGGLGGFDIYAVTCGMDGIPTGQPYRLPYPINSVNDDVFFIPEEGGGAWMASDRAALEGRVHAYRLGLGEGQMATGSVAWSADEVADEGLTLRVFAQGEEMASGALDGEDLGHIAFQGMEGVRLVLEDKEGNVLTEAFGDGVGAWELRKGSDGWVLEGQSDVAADWAVLSDLQVGAKAGSSDGTASEIAVNTDFEEEGRAGWSSWISGQLAAEEGLASDSESQTAEKAGEAEDDEKPEAEAVLMGSADEGIAEVDAVAGEDTGDELPDGRKDDSNEVADTETAAEEDGATQVLASEWKDQPIEVLNTDVPRSVEDLSALVEERPDVAIEIWESRAKEVLVLERDFLDDPDFSKAGQLFDMMDALEAWQPDASKMDNRLLDGVQVDDIREMLDEWSRAVQSATKASLAAVAGEAALAYRRERLAIRELWDVSGADITPLQMRWSQWLDAGRGVPGVDVELADLTLEDGDMLLSEWEDILSSSKDAWSRKESAGWRGDWVNRQMDQLERNAEVWQEHKETLEEPEAAPTSLAAVDSEENASNEEGQAESIRAEELLDEEVSALDLAEGPLLPLGKEEIDGAVMTLLFPEMEGEGRESNPSERQQNAMLELEVEWGVEALDDVRVAKAWERLERALDGGGIAPVMDAEAWGSLEPGVRSAYLDVTEASLNALEAVCSDDRPEKPAFVADGEELVPGFRDSFGTEGLDALIARWEVLQLQDERLEVMNQRARKAKGEEALGLVLERQRMLLESEISWRIWSEDWQRLQEEWEGALQEYQAEAAAIASDEKLESEDSERGADLALTPALSEDEDKGKSSDAEIAETKEEANPEDNSSSRKEDEAMGSTASKEMEGVTDEEVTVSHLTEPSTEVSDALEATAQTTNTDEIKEENRIETPEENRAVDPEERAESLAQLLGQEKGEADLIAGQLDSLETGVAQESVRPSPVVSELVLAWSEFKDIQGTRPVGSASRAETLAWDKRRFFNERRLRQAILDWREEDAVADLTDVQSSFVNAGNALSPVVDIDTGSGNAEENRNAGVRIGPADAEVEATVSRQDREIEGYGLVLPQAEIVGRSSGNGNRGRGLTLRPIAREALERAVLGSAVAVDVAVPNASERFASEAGAPLLEGVEYKVQVGAFRKALPAALFSAFDPMWAQTLSNGITRYMAGSFSAYDAAVLARDAIRELGYEDAFVVRFVDGQRVVGSSRPEPADLAVEREVERTNAANIDVASVATVPDGDRREVETVIPRVKEDIPTWDDVEGRVFSVQIGAFRGVPDANSLMDLGTLTREDAGTDGWLRLFSGRFSSVAEALDHRNSLRESGRADAFIVVYVNGRRIPLSEASTTAVSPLPGVASSPTEGPSSEENSVPETTDVDVDEVPADVAQRWYVELGVFSSTIPVRLANAILDAPLDWSITSLREGGLTRYRTRTTDEQEARGWLESARESGFGNARLSEEEVR